MEKLFSDLPEAIENTERLIYDYNISGNRLTIDEYFAIPADSKWSFDYVEVDISVPVNTVVHMDRTAENLFHSRYDDDFVGDPEKSFWIMTEDGLDYKGHHYR